MQSFRIPAYTMTSCLGRGVEPTAEALRARRGGLSRCDFETADLDTWIGEVDGLDAVALSPSLARFDCRNNRLAMMGLEQDGFATAVRAAAAQHGPDRVGVFLGTSTAGILSTELAYREQVAAGGSGPLPSWFRYRETHNTYSVADFVSHVFGIRGPAFVVSAACASSAKVFGNAARMLAAGRIDAAVVGGVDSLCLTTLYGFRSLELVSAHPAAPYGAGRDGLSIGEAAAFALIERDDGTEGPRLVGIGESSDAHHMSSPHPEGLGARRAMEAALSSAGLAPDDIDYINLHGTATPKNDAVEAAVVATLFDSRTSAGSTKGWTGHALGAAGIVEAVVCLVAMRDGHAPGTLGCVERDPTIVLPIAEEGTHRPIGLALSNAFAFGGNNCVLAFARDAATLAGACG